jgi:DNA-directed RNA polymerase specialized sigma24 family protein
LSFKQIAARAGIAETAAKLRSSRGMAQLRAILKGATEGTDPMPKVKK